MQRMFTVSAFALSACSAPNLGGDSSALLELDSDLEEGVTTEYWSDTDGSYGTVGYDTDATVLFSYEVYSEGNETIAVFESDGVTTQRAVPEFEVVPWEDPPAPGARQLGSKWCRGLNIAVSTAALQGLNSGNFRDFKFLLDLYKANCADPTLAPES